MDITSVNSLFYTFCGYTSLLNSTLLLRDRPIFSPCLLDTAPVWAACGYMILGSPLYLLYIWINRGHGLPVSYLCIGKTVLAIILACLCQLELQMRQGYGSACGGIKVVSPAAHAAMYIKLATYLWVAALIYIQQRYGVKTSGFPFVFWAITLVMESLQLYSYIVAKTQCMVQIIYYVYFVMVCLQLVLHCWAEADHKLTTSTDVKPCPEDGASVLTRITFQWLMSLIYSIYRKRFVISHLWDQSSLLRSGDVGPTLDAAWTKEIHLTHQKRLKETSTRKKHHGTCEVTPLLSTTRKTKIKDLQSAEVLHGKTRHPSLVKVILKTYRWNIMEYCLYGMLSVVLFFIVSIFLRLLIEYIDNKVTRNDPAWIGTIYAILLFITIETSSLLYNITVHQSTRLGIKIKTALMYVIYKKALTISKSGNQTSVGEVSNLMSVDCQRIQDSVIYSYYLPNGLLFTGGACLLLWNIVGIATLGGFAVIILILVSLAFIARLQNGVQKRLLQFKSQRVKLMSEILAGMKVLKMYTWELTFIKRVTALRQEEINNLYKNARLMAISTTISTHSQYMIHFVLILLYVLLRPDHHIGSQEVFVSLAIVVVVKYPLVMLPTVLNGIVQAYVSLGRVEAFLCCSDLQDDNVKFLSQAEYSVQVSEGTFSWENEDDTFWLQNIELKIRPGQLVAVVGHCGSGKTSLISALLGEMRRLAGHVYMKGSVAYVPQEAWIQNMTLRDNIVFGKEFNHTKYWRVIDNCALQPDLAIFDGGDHAEIGEKGTNISGGQKQRISLARAVYNNADIYLLDDPLSAVDAHVGKDLFKNVIGNSGLLKNKTRILVTHAIHWLPLVDTVIVLNNGMITEVGSYDELVLHNGPFAQFLLQYLTQADAAEAYDDPEIQCIRDSMLEQVESVTSDGGGASSEDKKTVKGKRLKKKNKLHRGISRLSTLSVSQSVKHTATTPVQAAYDVKRLTTEETVQEGSVKLGVAISYLRSMGIWGAIISVIAMILYQTVSVYSMFWLTFWTEDEFLNNQTNTNTDMYMDRLTMYLVLYFVMGILQVVALYFSFHLALTRIVKAADVLHGDMLYRVFRSRMSFFDTVPIGRILNRFASDIDIMDNKLPESYRLWISMFFATIASVLVVVIISSPTFLAVLVPAVVVFTVLLKFYLPSARKLRRLEAVTRSPIYNHFSESFTGSSVIRAYKCKERFIQEAVKRLDQNSKLYYASNSCIRWVSVRLEFIGSLFVLAATMFALLSNVTGAELGMSVNYAVQITFSLNSIVWAVAEMEMNAISIERVTEYTEVPSEAEWEIPHKCPSPDWPSEGKIEYRNFTTRYRPGLELVLRGVSFNINSGEKVGVVGRTGAGKSSLTLSLFRIIEAAGGAIFIDGVKISQLGLHDLRSKITILPQDPVLFSGSLRMNIDPLGEYGDDDVWRALECSHLKSFVMSQPERMEYDCGDSGQNLSVGQRQLVCLTRTLLHKTRILILDEATAAVDLATDALIQQTIQTQFHDCTILTIAHRLNTVMDYDRVMVLDKGVIVEFASPTELLSRTDGIFYSMAKDAGFV